MSRTTNKSRGQIIFNASKIAHAVPVLQAERKEARIAELDAAHGLEVSHLRVLLLAAARKKIFPVAGERRG